MSEYDKPLTDEEKALIDRSYNDLQKMIANGQSASTCSAKNQTTKHHDDIDNRISNLRDQLPDNHGGDLLEDREGAMESLKDEIRKQNKPDQGQA